MRAPRGGRQHALGVHKPLPHLAQLFRFEGEVHRNHEAGLTDLEQRGVVRLEGLEPPRAYAH